MGPSPILVTTTVSSKDEAEKIATALVDRSLAACVNIVGPVVSIYQWESNIQKDKEYKLFIKSFQKHWNSLKNEISNIHSYRVPEISLIHIADIHPKYLKWMEDVCP